MSTNKMFLDPFPDFLHSLSVSKGKIMVVDDFNFYFENEHDSEVCKLRSQLKTVVWNSSWINQLIAVVTPRTGSMMTSLPSTVLT